MDTDTRRLLYPHTIYTHEIDGNDEPTRIAALYYGHCLFCSARNYVDPRYNVDQTVGYYCRVCGSYDGVTTDPDGTRRYSVRTRIDYESLPHTQPGQLSDSTADADNRPGRRNAMRDNPESTSASADTDAVQFDHDSSDDRIADLDSTLARLAINFSADVIHNISRTLHSAISDRDVTGNGSERGGDGVASVRTTGAREAADETGSTAPWGSPQWGLGLWPSGNMTERRRTMVRHSAALNRTCNEWNGYEHDELGDYVCPGWPHEINERDM